jgi:hypothetical protein
MGWVRSSIPEHFARVQNAFGVKRCLQGTHDRKRLSAMFLFQEFPLAKANAVFA